MSIKITPDIETLLGKKMAQELRQGQLDGDIQARLIFEVLEPWLKLMDEHVERRQRQELKEEKYLEELDRFMGPMIGTVSTMITILVSSQIGRESQFNKMVCSLVLEVIGKTVRGQLEDRE